MSKLLAKKLNMSQVYKNEILIPVSVLEVDSEGDLEQLQEGGLVKVVGISKGKGFQGVVKRHGFGGGPKSHGQKDRLRAPGSIGSTAPQRVMPGRKMAGRMGQERVSVRNLKVVEVNKEKRIVLLKGAVPGNKNNKVQIIF